MKGVLLALLLMPSQLYAELSQKEMIKVLMDESEIISQSTKIITLMQMAEVVSKCQETVIDAMNKRYKTNFKNSKNGISNSEINETRKKLLKLVYATSTITCVDDLSRSLKGFVDADDTFNLMVSDR